MAYCVARLVHAVRQPWTCDPSRLAHADALAAAVGLDMADYWTPTVDGYLGRVTKAHILEAVREGVSERDADSLADLRKSDMASRAEWLLAGRRWLPAALRTPVIAPSEAPARPESVTAEGGTA